MTSEALPFEKLSPAIITYIAGLEASYKQQLQELERKYFELKESYDLLIYKKFARSAEQLLADSKQHKLFNEEGEPAPAVPEAPEIEKQEVKSYTRKKPGR